MMIRFNFEFKRNLEVFFCLTFVKKFSMAQLTHCLKEPKNCLYSTHYKKY